MNDTNAVSVSTGGISPVQQSEEQAKLIRREVASPQRSSADKGLGRQDEGKTKDESPDLKLTEENLDDAVARLSDHVQSVNRDLSFRVDDDSGRVVVTVLDTKTQEVIRQIPGEDAIALSAKVEDLGLRLLDDSV